MSELAQIVKGDKLALVIEKVIEAYNPIHVLEIGSSDGTGSTRVIADALKGKGANLYCIEMLDERVNALKVNTAHYGFVHCYNAASVGSYGLIEREEIEDFKNMHPEHELWRVMTMEEIYTWYDNTVKHIPEKKITDGITYIKNEHNIVDFDMVLIDGSPFTALEELHEVYGSDVIVLDDTMDLKCYDCLMMLLSDKKYTCIHRDDKYRNGYAVFKLKENV